MVKTFRGKCSPVTPRENILSVIAYVRVKEETRIDTGSITFVGCRARSKSQRIAGLEIHENKMLGRKTKTVKDEPPVTDIIASPINVC